MISGTEKNIINLVIENFGEVNAEIFEEITNTGFTNRNFEGLSNEEALELLNAAIINREMIIAENEEYQKEIAENKKLAVSIKAPKSESVSGLSKNSVYTRYESLPEWVKDIIIRKEKPGRLAFGYTYHIDEGHRYVTGSLKDLVNYIEKEFKINN